MNKSKNLSKIDTSSNDSRKTAKLKPIKGKKKLLGKKIEKPQVSVNIVKIEGQ